MTSKEHLARRDANKKWREANPNYSKEYYRAHREELKARRQAKEASNPEMALEAQERKKAYRAAHTDRYREYQRHSRRSNPERTLYNYAKRRAKVNGIEFSITLEDIVIPEVCPYLGIPIQFNESGTAATRSHSPSLDRIDPNLGYIVGNVVVVSHRGNLLKNDATIEELEMIVHALRRLRS